MTELQEKINKTSNRLRKLKRMEEEIENSKLIPALKKKYENKYFIFNNSNGGGGDKWPIYIKVIKVSGIRQCEIISFEKAPYGKIGISKEKFYFINMLQEQISKKEYTDAMGKIKGSINEWLKK